MQPMKDAPKDRKILAWHKVWKCWVSIQPSLEGHWKDCTLTTRWPTESFTGWIEPPKGPVE